MHKTALQQKCQIEEPCFLTQACVFLMMMCAQQFSLHGTQAMQIFWYPLKEKQTVIHDTTHSLLINWWVAFKFTWNCKLKFFFNVHMLGIKCGGLDKRQKVTCTLGAKSSYDSNRKWTLWSFSVMHKDKVDLTQNHCHWQCSNFSTLCASSTMCLDTVVNTLASREIQSRQLERTFALVLSSHC